MERAVQIFVAVNFLVIGLSHIFQHRAWAEFFVRLHGMGRPGAFAGGFISLIVGSIIVAFHNVWTGWPMALTILGWCYVLKSAIVMIRPDLGLRSMGRIRVEQSQKFIVAGVIMVLVAGVLGYAVVSGYSQDTVSQ